MAADIQSDTPLFHDNIDPATEMLTFEGVEMDHEYNVYFTQQADGLCYNIRGFFMVVEFENELVCRSEFIEDQYAQKEQVQEVLDIVTEQESLQSRSGREATVQSIVPLSLRNEAEPNNTRTQANRTYHGDDMYGKISTSSDVDWYVISFGSSGYANFWLGQIPSGKRYGMTLCNSSGGTLRDVCVTGGQQQIYRYRVSANTNYYLKIYGAGGTYHASSNYLLRAKIYSTPTPTFQYRWTNGMSNVQYYVHTDVSSYTTQIKNAANSWVSPLNGAGNTTALKAMTLISTPSSADIIFTRDTTLSSDTIGQTYFYANARRLGDSFDYEDQGNWKSCRIGLNPNAGLTSSNVQGVAAHELGHAWGLKHNWQNAYSIMCQLGDGRQTYWPECFDIVAFNGKY